MIDLLIAGIVGFLLGIHFIIAISFFLMGDDDDQKENKE